MNYSYTAFLDAVIPRAAEPVFLHFLDSYVSEVNKTVGVWRAVPDGRLDFRPHERVNPIRTILVHQLLSERRFFAGIRGLARAGCRRALARGRFADHAAVHRQIRLARAAAIAAIRTGHDGLVA